jgi:hypothetical protein
MSLNSPLGKGSSYTSQHSINRDTKLITMMEKKNYEFRSKFHNFGVLENFL